MGALRWPASKEATMQVTKTATGAISIHCDNLPAEDISELIATLVPLCKPLRAGNAEHIELAAVEYPETRLGNVGDDVVIAWLHRSLGWMPFIISAQEAYHLGVALQAGALELGADAAVPGLLAEDESNHPEH